MVVKLVKWGEYVMKIVILAGGGGKRLFPLSRSNYPKQFLEIDSNGPLLVQTVKRFLNIEKPENIIIVTNEKYTIHVKSDLKKCGAEKAHIISEPCPKNTAPAVALAVKYCIGELHADKDEAIFVAPSDHIIKPVDEFTKKVKECLECALLGKIVTMGVIPTKPDTGYGYIKVSLKYKKGFNVEKFVEKPDEVTAKKYFKDPSYYWNSGMYCFTVGTFIEEINKYSNQLYNYMTNKTYELFLKDFDALESISFDYAIAEKSDKIINIPLDIYWNDVGSWDSIYDYLNKDKQGNINIGKCNTVECKNTMIMAKDRLVTAVGLEDLLVVETSDALLISRKGESQKVKDVFEKIVHREEAHEHPKIVRPWGSYEVITKAEGYKVKKVSVLPGQKLSLQLHNHRSEHWIVINGEATVIIGGDDERVVRKNESIYVPKKTLHRLINKGDKMLELIEVQNGSYLGEDDIERFDDAYGR